MALTNNYDFEYDDVLLTDGDTRQIISATVFNSADIRTGDSARGQTDGLHPGKDIYGGKTVELTIEVWSPDPATFRASYLELMGALRKRPDEKVLKFRLPEWPDLRVNCRPRRVAGPQLDIPFDMGVATVTVQFFSTDPRILSDGLHNSIAFLSSTINGVTFDISGNISFGGPASPSSIVADNEGTYEAPWRAEILGPVTNPTLEHLASGRIMVFDGEVADGDSLVVISHPTPSVLLNGTASRYAWLVDPSQWFMLEPGQNEIRFGGTSAGVPSLTVEWRSAWTP